MPRVYIIVSVLSNRTMAAADAYDVSLYAELLQNCIFGASINHVIEIGI